MKHFCKEKNLKKLFWYLIYTIPIWAYLITIINNGNVEFINILQQFGMSENNIIYSTFNNIFGESGIIEIFTNSSIFLFIVYYIGVKLLHISTDIILMLLQIVHNFVDKMTNEKDNEKGGDL